MSNKQEKYFIECLRSNSRHSMKNDKELIKDFERGYKNFLACNKRYSNLKDLDKMILYLKSKAIPIATTQKEILTLSIDWGYSNKDWCIERFIETFESRMARIGLKLIIINNK